MSESGHHRSQAQDTLYEFSFIILVYLILMDACSDHQLYPFWKREVEDFIQTLRKFNAGKKNKCNYVNPTFLAKVLKERLEDEFILERIDVHLQSKGLDVDSQNIDFSRVDMMIDQFARGVFEGSTT